LCKGQCTDINTDSNNCGQCGNMCTDTQTCQDGKCISPSRKCPVAIATSCTEVYCPPPAPGMPTLTCCPWCPRCMTSAECSMYAPT
jgi:hypothetical protein